MTKIINTTPHDVVIVINGKVVKTFPKTGMTIRLSEKTEEVGTLEGVPLTHTEYGCPVLVTPEGEKPLPAPEEGVWYLVSGRVQDALPKRKDLLVPSGTVRNDHGEIIGCKSLGV